VDFSNYLEIKNEIPLNVNLLAVSKGFKSQEIKILNKLGQNHFGESRFQEALEKKLNLKELEDIKWHFIGKIQSNKIKKIVQNFQFIHSVDSYEKLQKISIAASQEMKNPTLMLQVKFLDDPNKGGFNPDSLRDKWMEIQRIENVNISGLMTINPKGLSSKENLEVFKKCRELADSFNLADCSMGMSGDWREAISAGSTWLRLGSIIFGHRLFK
jgi:hypothetical protein